MCEMLHLQQSIATFAPKPLVSLGPSVLKNKRAKSRDAKRLFGCSILGISPPYNNTLICEPLHCRRIAARDDNVSTGENGRRRLEGARCAASARRGLSPGDFGLESKVSEGRAP